MFIVEDKISISIILFPDAIFSSILFFYGVEGFIISTFLSEAIVVLSTLLTTALSISTYLFT